MRICRYLSFRVNVSQGMELSNRSIRIPAHRNAARVRSFVDFEEIPLHPPERQTIQHSPFPNQALDTTWHRTRTRLSKDLLLLGQLVE
jgi:hypothetical protein